MAVCRAADLVADHPDSIMGAAHVYHGLDEVLSIQAEHPGDPHYEILVRGAAYRQFSFEFGLPVVIERRVILVVRLPRSRALSVEYVVGREIYDLCIDSGEIGIDGAVELIIKFIELKEKLSASGGTAI